MNENADDQSVLIQSDGLYDKMKVTAEFILPALATLYFTLANIWNWGYAEEVVGSIAAVNALIGVLVVVARKLYNAGDAKYAGDLVVTENEEGAKTASLELKDDPYFVDQQNEVTFRVKKERA